MMNLPNKLSRSTATSCVLNDQRERPALFTANDYDYDEPFKNEVIKRYNSYNKLVIALYIVTTLLLISLTFQLCTS